MTQTPTDALRLVPDCPCNRCAQEAVDADGGSPFDPRLVRMFCCVQCGNKRCPHATDHRLSCTGSNEVGQEGSSYGPPLKSAAPASPLPGGGWQDISTAPKDGTEVLVMLKPKVIRLGWYFKPSSRTEGWCDENGKRIIPSHWMPLPAAPTGDA